MTPLSVGCPRSRRRSRPPTRRPLRASRAATAERGGRGRPPGRRTRVGAPADAGGDRAPGRRRRGHDQGHRPERRHVSIRSSPSGSRRATGCVQSWCTTCAESRNADSAVRSQRPLRPRRADSCRRAGPRLQARRRGAAAPPGPPGGRAQPDVRRRMRAAAGDDAAAAAAGDLLGMTLDNARLVAREPAHPPDQRAPDDGQRSPRLAGAGAHLHADADEPAARRDPRATTSCARSSTAATSTTRSATRSAGCAS